MSISSGATMIDVLIAAVLFVDGGFDLVAQRHAEREASLMAERRVCEHLLGVAPNAKFSGVGISTNPQPKVCFPWEHGSNAKTLIADAIVERDGMFFRSCHWK